MHAKISGGKQANRKKDSASIDHFHPQKKILHVKSLQQRPSKFYRNVVQVSVLHVTRISISDLALRNLVCVGQLISVMENFISIHVVFQIL